MVSESPVAVHFMLHPVFLCLHASAVVSDFARSRAPAQHEYFERYRRRLHAHHTDHRKDVLSCSTVILVSPYLMWHCLQVIPIVTLGNNVLSGGFFP